MTALLYAAASVALVGIAIISDSTQRKLSAWNRNNHSKYADFRENLRNTDGKNKIRFQNMLEYGLLNDVLIEARNNTSSLALQDATSSSNIFQYNPINDYPDWVPENFQNPWTFLALTIVASLALCLVVLGQERISAKWAGWVSWYEMNETVRRGVMYPQFPVHILNGLLAVVGPILILRDLGLNVALLGALVFAEHAVQLLSAPGCGALISAHGPKAGQHRAALLFLASSAALAAQPLFLLLPPPIATAAGPWPAFALYAAARMLHAWGAAQLDAACGAALGNSAFLPPHHLLRALDLLYCASMAGGFAGALLALLASAAGDLRWALLLPVALASALYLLVESIPQARVQLGKNRGS